MDSEICIVCQKGKVVNSVTAEFMECVLARIYKTTRQQEDNSGYIDSDPIGELKPEIEAKKALLNIQTDNIILSLFYLNEF